MGCVSASRREEGSGGGRSCDGGSVWKAVAGQRLGTVGPVENRHIPSASRATRLHPQTGIDRETTAGDPHGARSGGSGGGGERDRTDLRKGFCRTQLRLPPRTRLQR